MTPVILLSDGFIANGAEPWKLPDVDALPELDVAFRTDPAGFQSYMRDPETLARPWALPGTPGLEFRIGGLEKADGSGNVSYDPDNHERMVRLRAEKVARVAASIPPADVEGDADADVLVLGWGSTYGSIVSAVRRCQAAGRKVAHVQLRHMNPFPANLGEILDRYPRVLVPEINLGQLAGLIRARYLKPVTQLNQVRGLPFKGSDIQTEIDKLCEAEG